MEGIETTTRQFGSASFWSFGGPFWLKPACEGLQVLKARLNLTLKEFLDLFGVDSGRGIESVDNLVAKGEARGTSVGVMVCFEQFSDELGFL